MLLEYFFLDNAFVVKKTGLIVNVEQIHETKLEQRKSLSVLH